MRFAFAALILLHGLVHVLGFGKALGWAVPLRHEVSKARGLSWLFAAGLFAVGAILVVMQKPIWWLPVLPAVVLSQTLIVLAWTDAKFGTLPNALVLLPLVVTLLDYRASSYTQTYRREVAERLSSASPDAVVTSDDAAHLPDVVRRYVELTGTLGRPRVKNFRVTMQGQIRRSTEAGWMAFQAEQHGFFDAPARLFLLRASQFGVPFDAYHRYVGSAATMQVRVASLFQVVDARGPEMNRSETVTMFNDMCMLAPAILIDRTIRWKALDPKEVEATFQHAKNTISAVLSFNEAGELTNFRSDDRYLSADGKTYTQYRWSTPMRDYRDFDGRRIATRGEASWRLPDGEFVYARIEIVNIGYNVERR